MFTLFLFICAVPILVVLLMPQLVGLSIGILLLGTDQWGGYNKLNREYPHEHVDHSIGQYVVGAVHTQTIEGVWSLIKRGMIGTFHKVSRKYLPLYVADFQFRYNNRENENIFAEAIRGC